MVDLSLVPWGIAIGLAVSAPLGPINFMCIRQTLRRGLWSGVVTGFGSVVGDGIFATAAALGLKAVSDLIAGHAGILQLAGGIFLLVLGVHAYRSRIDPAELAAGPSSKENIAIFGTTLALTLTNPFTMAGFVAIFGGASRSLAQPGDYGAVVTIVVSVMAGSLLWWIFLSSVVAHLRGRLDSAKLALINRLTGAVVALFGIFLLGRMALSLLS